MIGSGPAHPLDVELADLVDGALDEARATEVEAHLAGCLLCRVKCQRLRAAPPLGVSAGGGPVPWPPAFDVPATRDRRDVEPGAGQLWLAGPDDDQRLLVLVLRVDGDRVAVAPVTFDVEAADDETVVVDASRSPLGLALAAYPALATEVPAGALVSSLGALPGALEGERGTAITGATDPRLDVRQYLADRLGALEDVPPDPDTAADAPVPAIDDVRSRLVRDLRSWRGNGCAVRPLFSWNEVVVADRIGWEPVAAIDEIGIVLVVFDTPHGLVDDEDFDAARSVLTRFNATAVVVLAGAISGEAEVFDAPALNYGIETPSGVQAPPRPLIAGLAAIDAVAKFLDQSTGARAMSPPSRGAVTRVDVGEILRDATAEAVANSVKQAAKFKIAPKRRGYESLADVAGDLGIALGRALAAQPVVDELLGLASRDGDE
ncbi:MAG: zf-HC2 domain-containing protein [Acidimicrobiales bacterium]